MATASGLKPSHDQPDLARLWDSNRIVAKPSNCRPTRCWCDIVGLYMNPPDYAVVLCLDEKSQIQALDRTQPLLPMRPGQAERRTQDYKRHGATCLFAALEVKTSRLIGLLHRRHRSPESRQFLDVVDAQVPADLDMHIIMDNYDTHKTPLIRNWLAKRPRYDLYFTPTYGSWMNLVERWFAELTNKRLHRGVHRSVRELETAIQEFLAVQNENPIPSYGPRRRTRSWPASPVSRNELSPYTTRRLTWRINETETS